MSVADAVLDINPDSVLQFNLSSQEATPNCTLELRHPDLQAPPIAFKVKTTQPRRYLVRPNQGLISPGEETKVQILLVEKDKNSLLQSYQRLGQSALDHSKDKFLVQSVAVIDDSLVRELKDYDQLTALWSSVGTSNTDNKRTSAVANKKLAVRHVVADTTTTSTPAATTPAATTREPIDNLSMVELRSELTTLRRKYDELVAFSVNLTAERDMLNNTLEQTKRDLNRQVAKTAAADNAGGRRSSSGVEGSSGFNMWIVTFVLAVMALYLGIRLEQMGLAATIPLLGKALQQPQQPAQGPEEL